MDQQAVEWRTRDVRYELFAARAEWKKGTWVFYDAQLQIFRPPTNDLPQLLSTNVWTGQRVGGSPAQLRAEIKVSQMDKIMAAKRLRLSLSEIMEYRKLHPGMKTDRAALLMTQFGGGAGGVALWRDGGSA